jgi:hypothetical protein
MSSRQEEKEARKKARLEEEAKEQRAATRKRRLQLVVGGVLAAGIVAAVVFALMAAGGSSSEGPSDATTTAASLPEPAILDEQEAAKAAGCEFTTPENEGAGHEERDFTPADYKVNPPTSGMHFPSWAEDGIYEPGNTPGLGELVHTLEHGRVNIQYKPGTDPKTISQLEAFVGENQGYHMLLYENASGMRQAVAATSWDNSLTCDSTSPELWDALRTFRDAHLDKAPEKVP